MRTQGGESLTTGLACLVRALPIEKRALLPVAFEQEIESARTMLLNSEISDHVLVGLETSAFSIQTLLASVVRHSVWNLSGDWRG